MTAEDETPEQAAERRRQELLRDMDRSMGLTAELISQHPERYLPPYSGQKPRETPAPDRVVSPERQDPDLPPRERPAPLIREVPEPEREKDTHAKSMEFNSPEWRAAQAAELAKKGVSPEAAQAQILGLLGHAQPPSAAVERKPPRAPERTGQDRDTPGQGLGRTR